MHQKVVDILECLGIDIAWCEYDGNSDEYIIFRIFDDEGNFADNKNQSEFYDITINYYFKDLTKIVMWEKIKELFKENGFKYDGGVDVNGLNTKCRKLGFTYEKPTP